MNKIQKSIAWLLGIKAASVTGNGNGRFVVVNGSVVWMGDNVSTYVSEGYGANDIVYSAISLIANKIRVAPWQLFKVVDESSLRQSKRLLQAGDYGQAAYYQRKALEPLKNTNLRTGKWEELLKWPNEYETFQDFVANGASYKMITGNKFWWANLIEDGANKGLPHELYNLPSQYVSIIATTGWPVKSVGYQLNIGTLEKFGKEQVLHEKYFNPEYDANGSHLYGQSPFKAARKNLTRNNYAKAATTARFENSGADSIIFVNDNRLSPDEGMAQATAVKKMLAGEYAGAENNGKIAASGYPMGHINLKEAIKDMEIFKGEDLDLRRICNILEIPSQLLNDTDNKTYNNLKEAEKALTQRCALPQLISSRESLNHKVGTDWGLKGEGVVFDFDLSAYSELQEDQKTKWEWVSKLPVSSRYKMEMMGLDVPDDPRMDVILIDGSPVTLDDIINSIDPNQMQQVSDALVKMGLHDYVTK